MRYGSGVRSYQAVLASGWVLWAFACGENGAAVGPTTTPRASATGETAAATGAAAPVPDEPDIEETDPAEATDPPDRAALLGAWQDSPDVGSGYTGLLLIFDDGSFVEWEPGACRRYVSERRGGWALEGTTLSLTERERVEVLGGAAVRDGDTCYWENERTRRVEVASPRPRNHVLAGCNENQRESGAGRCARFGRKARWRIVDEDGARRELLPELGLGGS